MAGTTTENISVLIQTLQHVGQIYERFSPGDIPMPGKAVFDSAIDQCKVAINTLDSMKSQSNKQIGALMVPKLAICQTNARKLEQMLRTCVRNEELPAYASYIKAIKQGQEKIEIVIMGILYEIQKLVDLNSKKFGAEQMVKLREAIQALKEGGSSMPEEKTEMMQFSYNNYGSGAQGNQSMAGGTSEMYVGTTQTFNRGENH